jgi:multicomponent Na+:H+ antiporter subunit G
MRVLSEVLAAVGAALILLAGVGVVRFPDLYSRMHAVTKATTVGIGLIAIAAIVGIDGRVAKIVLAFAIFLVTAPAGSHLVARAVARSDDHDPA